MAEPGKVKIGAGDEDRTRDYQLGRPERLNAEALSVGTRANRVRVSSRGSPAFPQLSTHPRGSLLTSTLPQRIMAPCAAICPPARSPSCSPMWKARPSCSTSWGRLGTLGASDDATTQMLWRQVRAKVLARRGERVEAERLAREAVAVCEATDMLNAQGDVYGDLAEVLSVAGKPDEAAAALEQALGCYERKGNLVSTQRTRTRLTEVLHAAP